MHITNPSYISQETFDAVVYAKFINNSADNEVRKQAVRLIQLFRSSSAYSQILTDISYAAKVSRHASKEQVAEIAFAMGLQFGFELALSCPPGREQS